ncbi:MAG: M28 family metallopeptidase [Flavobacteriaceae bacterium]
MKKTFLLILTIGFAQCTTQNKIKQAEVRAQISLEETQRLLSTLADDEMLGRDLKSGGYFKAADFVSDYFKTHHIEPFYPDYRDSIKTKEGYTYNIVGRIGAYRSERSTILIGAHLDHIGLVEGQGDTIFNGANDNASGSTAVMQIARFLAQKKWQQNIIVVLFAEEEKKLLGAQHLAMRLKEEDITLHYMVNFEMIGKTLTTGENQVYITGYQLSNMANVMNQISPNFVQFLPQAKEYNLFQRSDNYSFYEAFDIPAQTLSSFDFKNYAYYHNVEDEAEKMDIANMNAVIGTAAYTLSQLLTDQTQIKMYSQTDQ